MHFYFSTLLHYKYYIMMIRKKNQTFIFMLLQHWVLVEQPSSGEVVQSFEFWRVRVQFKRFLRVKNQFFQIWAQVWRISGPKCSKVWSIRRCLNWFKVHFWQMNLDLKVQTSSLYLGQSNTIAKLSLKPAPKFLFEFIRGCITIEYMKMQGNAESNLILTEK